MRPLLLVALMAVLLLQPTSTVLSDDAPPISDDKPTIAPANKCKSDDATRDGGTTAWLGKIDQALDANLSGTLASIALAAAAFVVSLLPALEKDLRDRTEEHKEDAGDAHSHPNNETKQKDADVALLAKTRAMKRLSSAKTATSVLVYAFGAFLVGLISSLTVDPAADRMVDVLKFHFLPIADVATSVGSMLTGVVCLVFGAIHIRRLTL